MTCITFDSVNDIDQSAGRVQSALRRGVRGATDVQPGCGTPRKPVGVRIARVALRFLMTPFRVYAGYRDRAYADFRMIDVHTLDDIGLVRSDLAAVGTPDNENTRQGDVA